MIKRKVTMLVLVATLTSTLSQPILAMAEELRNSKEINVNNENYEEQVKVSKFELSNNVNLNEYNKIFKIWEDKIISIKNNGGKYGSQNIEKAIDGEFNTHWETGKANTSSYKNEVEFQFESIENINRIVYATRQDGAKGKGFPTEFSIYASLTEDEDDYTLVGKGSHETTGDIMEFKFKEVQAKRIKFVFDKANQNWASAAEFQFYKVDNIIEKMNKIFTDASKSKVSEEFNTLEKLEVFEREASTHPLYGDIEEDISNAKILLEGKKLEFVEAKVSNFRDFNDNKLSAYDEIFKVPLDKVKSITTNGGHYAANVIERAMDGDINTNWHSGNRNTSNHTNEVMITLDELTTIDRIMYTSLNSRGFAEEFEIYGSRTSEGDTFEKISGGSMSITTKNTLQIKFKETEIRRIKFVYTKGYENWALASEFGLYKSDNIAEKIDRLFIDENTNEVNPEFGTIDSINSLINEIKGHPFEDEYIEKLNIAKELVEFGQVQAGTANVSKFLPFYTEYINEYDDVYRVKNFSISNNGGQYGGSSINYAIDESVDTHWETGKPNSSAFKNEVVLTLDKEETINRLTYKSRVSGKGFAEKFSIYVSPVNSGDNYQKISEGSYTTTSDMVEIQFDSTKVRRVKFVFDKAREDWASISDIRLYKEDMLSDKMKRLFTNGLMDTVSEEFNSIEKLENLENEVKEHPLAPNYLKEVEIAKDILNGTLQSIKTIVAEQHGDRNAHANQNLKFGFGNNNQPTGIVARPGEKIVVYVDAEPGEPLPQLMFSQQEGSFSSWGRSVSLHSGKNEIIVPAVSQESWYNHSVTPGGPVYIVNPYAEEQQGKAPKIRFAEGGEQFPMFDRNTDEKEFLDFLKEYKARVDADAADNPDVMDRKMIDTFELVTDHFVFTGTATGAYEAYFNKGGNPTSSINMFNEYGEEMFKNLGLDGRSEKHDIKYTRENIRLAQPFGYMYAAAGHIGVQSDVMSSLLLGNAMATWGIVHEIGHKTDIGVRTIGEVTNNMLAQHMAYVYNTENKRIPFESHTFKNVIGTDNNEYYSGGYFEKLAVFWQLEMIYPGYWGKLNSQYRDNNVVLDEEDAASDKLNQLAKYSSIALELNLTEHFERHGFWISDETKELLSKYEKPEIKTWYANYDYIEYKSNGLNGDPELKVEIFNENGNTKLRFDVDNESRNDILGYEILKDGKVIGFTSTNSFIDIESTIGKSVNYTIIPYDKKLKRSKEVIVNSLMPNINVQQEDITVKLREEFNPVDLVKALNYNGEDITSKVEINGSVNVNEKGNYPLEYVIEDSGVTVSKKVNVQVVSNYDYLSDKEWTSVTAEYGTPRRNSSIKGKINGEVKNFDKGFGIHANGKITYDLSGVDYDNFEALVGVDMGIDSQNSSSITFKVIGDGKILATTNVLKHEDNMVAINVPIKGVEELVIEITDGGNGRTLDHGVIANPKVTTNNVKPSLSVTDKSYKLGEKVDFISEVTAFDVEDGDLTSNIEVILNNYEEGKVGRYEVVYRVTDSDNNATEKTSYITMYEELATVKSKYGQFNNLNEYNELFKLPVVSVSNNGGKYGSSIIDYAIDNNRNTHWETGKPNSDSFKNEVIFDLGEITEIDKMAYAARNGGKGFATEFEIYVSSEAEGDDFILAGTGSYNGSINDVIEIDITRREARRVKFKFIDANQGWASIGEMSFYKNDLIADKVIKELFTDINKDEVTEKYNTLEKLEGLRKEVSNHPAAEIFQDDLNRAEQIIRAKFPTLNIPKSVSTKVGEVIDIFGKYNACDTDDGDLTNKVITAGKVNFNEPGEYTLTYTVTDSDNNTITKTRTIAVVDMEDYTYLTDYSWKSTSNSYAAPKKDISASGKALRLTNENGNEVSYERGIGAHATSTIIYDLSDKNYDYFTSYVGVDRQMFGTVGSVGFEVWVDGEKKFDSGKMESRDQQKYVEVDINGAKELKLVVNDGGNGIGSDHATWGNTKLHYAKEREVKVDYGTLEEALNNAKEINLDNYTKESTKALKAAIKKAGDILENKSETQENVNKLVEEIKDAVKSLVEIDYSEIVSIEDKFLKNAIKKELNLKTSEITVGDMLKLTKLVSNDGRIESLKGLEYATNLESLNLFYNQVRDLTPIKSLKKLKEYNFKMQNIVVGTLEKKNNKIVIKDNIIDSNGNKLAPTKIQLMHNRTHEVILLDIAEEWDGNKVTVDLSTLNLDDYVYTVKLLYENDDDNYEAITTYMLDNR